MKSIVDLDPRIMPPSRTAAAHEKPRARDARLDIRIDRRTKEMVARAAALERRSLTDFCLTALTAAARHTIAQREAFVLSERDRQIFFDALVHPPRPNARLRRAFRNERKSLAP